MPKRLQILLDDQESRAIQGAARRHGVTVAEWARRALREAQIKNQRAIDAKLRAIAKSSRHEFPTADIEDMLREIEA